MSNKKEVQEAVDAVVNALKQEADKKAEDKGKAIVEGEAKEAVDAVAEALGGK